MHTPPSNEVYVVDDGYWDDASMTIDMHVSFMDDDTYAKTIESIEAAEKRLREWYITRRD
jgi:hypothetical protein